MSQFILRPEYLESARACLVTTNEETPPMNEATADHQQNVDSIVQEIAQRIFAATNLRPLLSQKAGKELSLQETVGLIVQSQDAQSHQDTPALITQLSAESKILLGRVVTELGKHFTSLNLEDLKVISLLFGVSRITAMAAKSLEAATNRSRLEEIEAQLKDLEALRAKYPREEDLSRSEAEREFLQKVDSAIALAKTTLTTPN